MVSIIHDAHICAGVVESSRVSNVRRLALKRTVKLPVQYGACRSYFFSHNLPRFFFSSEYSVFFSLSLY